ncbi:extracellular solute-binding protein [Spiractinospora alimapuensis]|uniref:ABC transporter substrate-binding protein n=1 Tax=Spiractinospora alimapuensis TaxID=2820884 RepID=UPI001F42F30F|nr:extracellular solute-binding protein [Spiractinospora alimapuensis]QVQ54347.1 extracellular solute-binding protein [Spiractinospora alimapuensis]
MRPLSPRHATLAAAMALGLTAVTACGGSGASDDGTLEIWSLEDEVLNPLLQETIDAYNEENSGDDDVQLELVTFQNDPYKERLQVAMGSPEHPDVFFNWGGGNLAQYVEAGQVYDMSDHMDANPEFRDAFIPSVMDVVVIDDATYGVPMLGTQPVSFFYNAAVFDAAGAEPPETFDELLDLVEVFEAEDVTPVALPGAAPWTLLMWVSYLVDRIGGPEVYQAISDGEDGAWEDPAVVETMETVQELVDVGMFGTNYTAVDWDGGQATTLVAEGQAAMILMGPWFTQDAEANAPEFFESGDLGWFPFPELEDGAGDPANVVGPPSNYFSIHAEASDPDAALEWLTEYMASDSYVDGLIGSGAVPTVTGIDDKLAETDDGEFPTWLYERTMEAPTFTPAWDQDLDPGVAESMLTNFSLVFEQEMSPEEFAESMEATS